VCPILSAFFAEGWEAKLLTRPRTKTPNAFTRQSILAIHRELPHQEILFSGFDEEAEEAKPGDSIAGSGANRERQA
jgi:hypothetical protein